MAANGSPQHRAAFPAAPRAEAQDAARRILATGLAHALPPGGGPGVGVILGSGLGGLAWRLEGERSLSAAETGWLPRVTAPGHEGRLVWGACDGRTVVMLQGRIHAYEGGDPESLSRGVELFAALGVRRLLITNAAGGLKPGLHVGEIVILEEHLDLVRHRWRARPAEGSESVRPRKEPPRDAVAEACRDAIVEPGPRRAWQIYDRQLALRAVTACKRIGRPARLGCYAYVLGPTYETRAEYRMLRGFGADIVGMSSVPEAAAAVAFGVSPVVASVVTNLARPESLPASRPETLADEVCEAAAAAADGIWEIVRTLAAG